MNLYTKQKQILRHIQQSYGLLSTRLSRTNTQKRCSFHHRGLECKSRKSSLLFIPEITGKLALECKMKQGKGQQSFTKRTHWSQQTPSSNNTRDEFTHGHHQMVNTEIRLIIFFAAKVGEALYSHQKQDGETVAQTMNSLLPNSDLD